jgi:hypothetical protein
MTIFTRVTTVAGVFVVVLLCIMFIQSRPQHKAIKEGMFVAPTQNPTKCFSCENQAGVSHPTKCFSCEKREEAQTRWLASHGSPRVFAGL